jgi:hypothetical protein
MNVVKAKLLVVRRHWYHKGQQAEQARIVELLSNIAWTSITKTDDNSRMVNTRDLVKLIEGETND